MIFIPPWKKSEKKNMKKYENEQTTVYAKGIKDKTQRPR